MMKRLSIPIFLVAFIHLFAIPAHAEPSRVFTKEELVQRLTGESNDENSMRPTTRGLRGVTVEGDRNHSSLENRSKSIDLEINFDYNSATLTPDARIVLDRLGEALSDPKLSQAHFLIAGHTDAKGVDSYNLQLSKERARAVADYLGRFHRVSLSRLKVEGYGESRLLDTLNPESGINRRVQVTNLD